MVDEEHVPDPTDVRRRIVVFLAATFALGSVFYYLIISAGTLSAHGGLFTLGLMLCPGVAGIATRLFFQKNLRGMGWGWGQTRYQLLSYTIPVFCGVIVYGVVWAAGWGGFSSESFSDSIGKSLGVDSPGLVVALALAGTVGFLLGAVPGALGEELGWRGFLVPELAKITSYTRTSLISAFVWAVYHYPVLIYADYNAGTPWWYSLVCFTVSISSASFLFAWARLRSGSLWAAVILHASHNLFIQGVFDGLTQDTGATKYITTEFGVGLAIVYPALAYYFWRKRGELPGPG